MKAAGFADSSILVAMQTNPSTKFCERNLGTRHNRRGNAHPARLRSGRVLIMVEAEERSADALNILNRNHAVTGGVRIQAP